MVFIGPSSTSPGTPGLTGAPPVPEVSELQRQDVCSSLLFVMTTFKYMQGGPLLLGFQPHRVDQLPLHLQRVLNHSRCPPTLLSW